MIVDLSTTTTFPDYDGPMGGYTLDEAYWDAQESLWSTYFGDLLAWALFACLTIQVYFYFINFPQDRRLIKLTVLTLFIMEVFATAFLTWTGYVTHIVHWGHAVEFVPGIWGAMLFDCTIASIVHALYAWRIYKLIARRWLAKSLAAFIMLLSVSQWSCCLTAAMYGALQLVQGPGNQFIARKFFHAWLLLATSADVIITTVMAIKLFSARTGIRSTDRAINKLLYVTIPGGAITAVVTLSILIIQLIYPDTMYYQILIICLTKFYSNSVVVCLNLRASTVNGVGRHTMLTGFHTDDMDTSSRLPFEVKVNCKVHQYTSSAVVNSSGFQSDPVSSTSEYGFGQQNRKMAGAFNLQYPNTHTMPFDSEIHRNDVKEKSSFGALTEVSCHGHAFHQSSDNVAPLYIPSVCSALSTKASGGHDIDDKENMPMATPDSVEQASAHNSAAKPSVPSVI